MRQNGRMLPNIEVGNAWKLRTDENSPTNWFVGQSPGIHPASLQFMQQTDRETHERGTSATDLCRLWSPIWRGVRFCRRQIGGTIRSGTRLGTTAWVSTIATGSESETETAPPMRTGAPSTMRICLTESKTPLMNAPTTANGFCPKTRPAIDRVTLEKQRLSSPWSKAPTRNQS